MFSNVRWRIALWFIGLSTAAYIIPTILAMVLFHMNLTAAIDDQLKVFLASFGHAISVVEGKPVLRDWVRTVQTEPPHSLVAYQLFDRQGRLLEEHGLAGIAVLFHGESEVSNKIVTMRTRMTPLKENGQTIGFLQVQLSTEARDSAVRVLALVTVIIAPVVLLGLGSSAYLVSEKATVSIRRSNAMLRQFVADASHELYTPLSIVQAASESLEKTVRETGLVLQEFEITESALERMEQMLEDLMLLSSMDSPGIGVRSSEEIMAIGAMLLTITNEFRPKFARKSVGLVLEMTSEVQVRGDSMSLHRMFANIIENALRYTEPQGHVAISLTKEHQQARVRVSDSGIGIPQECLSSIFDRFYRVDSSRSRGSGGSGLGLSIALSVAQTHGGTIEAQSDLGHGSTFTVVLPTVSGF